jgi:hypothetical protein
LHAIPDRQERLEGARHWFLGYSGQAQARFRRRGLQWTGHEIPDSNQDFSVLVQEVKVDLPQVVVLVIVGPGGVAVMEVADRMEDLHLADRIRDAQ